MKLYLLKQYEHQGYGTYDSMIVAANSEDDARLIHPVGGDLQPIFGDEPLTSSHFSWVTFEEIDRILVKYLGETDECRGVILASYNSN